MHTDVAQTAALHAIPAFAAWARARGFEVGDWVEQYVDPNIYPEPCLIVMVVDDTCKMVDSATCHLNVDLADCLLMASESDLMDYAETLGVVVIEYDGMGSYSVAINQTWVTTSTRIGALVAAVEAVGGGE